MPSLCNMVSGARAGLTLTLSGATVNYTIRLGGNRQLLHKQKEHKRLWARAGAYELKTCRLAILNTNVWLRSGEAQAGGTSQGHIQEHKPGAQARGTSRGHKLGPRSPLRYGPGRAPECGGTSVDHGSQGHKRGPRSPLRDGPGRARECGGTSVDHRAPCATDPETSVHMY